MNRSHDSQTAKKCVYEAQRAGIQNISIDLIYGVPEYLKRDWLKDLDLAIALKTPHISAYNLTVENRTVLSSWVNENKCTMPDQEVCNIEYEQLVSRLSNAGYKQYEVSNFSKKGYKSRHNSSYWGMTPYLGIGPSAHSYDGNRIRKWNVANNMKYIKEIKGGQLNPSKEVLSDIDLANEIILLGTRTTFGVSINKVLNYLNQNQKNVFLAQLELLKKKELISIHSHCFFVEDNSRFLSDYIARELIILS